MKSKNLIFDLGGVVVDVDAQQTQKAFLQILASETPSLYSFKTQSTLFDELEKGKMAYADFEKKLLKFCLPHIKPNQIKTAWNAMLQGVPQDKLELLIKLQVKYRVLALSNTNLVHIDWCNNYVSKNYGKNLLADYFHRAYYSFEMGFRKPEKEAFQYVLDVENIEAENCLMIDDRPENLDVAASLGMQCQEIKHPDEFYGLVQKLLLEN